MSYNLFLSVQHERIIESTPNETVLVIPVILIGFSYKSGAAQQKNVFFVHTRKKAINIIKTNRWL